MAKLKQSKTQPAVRWGILIGRLYTDGWDRKDEPKSLESYFCPHCNGRVGEEHILHKRFYYPWTHWKVRQVYVCLKCGNEEEATTTTVKAGKPETCLDKFRRLSKGEQNRLLELAGLLEKGGTPE